MGDHAEAVEPFPEESLANRGDPILTDFQKDWGKTKNKQKLAKEAVLVVIMKDHYLFQHPIQ